MKNFVINVVLVVLFFSIGATAATTSVLAMNMPGYIKWQSQNTSSVSAGKLNDLYGGISHFLRGNNNGKQLQAAIDKANLTYKKREIEHLLDVRKVFRQIKNLNSTSFKFLVGGIILLLVLKGTAFAFNTVYRICLLLIFVYIIFAALNYFGFVYSFDFMHKLLFKEGSWLFAEDSFLIKLFPFQFWRNSAIIAFLGSVGQFSLLGLASKIIYLKLSGPSV